jgi:2,3-dihydroxybiphenyl 1,2-dioxygenase
MDILGLGYVGLESPNAKDWLEYGPEVLGLGLNESRSDDTVYLRMDDRHHRIAVRPGPTDRLAYLGWEVKHRVAFEAAVERLREAGIVVTLGDAALEEERAVLEVAQFVDPAGFHHELFYGQRFHPGSFRPGRPMAGFVAEELGLGHVVLIHPEPNPAIRRFCEDVMGFNWFGHGVKKGLGSFYRTKLNPRSHCISYACIPGLSGLHHIGIEVRELDDVGITYDLTQEREIPLHMTLGRHSQDPVISFYTYTCTGGMVEYLWGGAIVPDATYVEKAPERLSVWGHKTVSTELPSTLYPVSTV